MSDQAPSTDDLFQVAGKTALVTGGGRGIGLMIARGLVRAGVRVTIASRRAADLEEAAAELRRDGACEAITADLSTPEGARELAEQVSRRVEALNILVEQLGSHVGVAARRVPGVGLGPGHPYKPRGHLPPDRRVAAGAQSCRRR